MLSQTLYEFLNLYTFEETLSTSSHPIEWLFNYVRQSNLAMNGQEYSVLNGSHGDPCTIQCCKWGRPFSISLFSNIDHGIWWVVVKIIRKNEKNIQARTGVARCTLLRRSGLFTYSWCYLHEYLRKRLITRKKMWTSQRDVSLQIPGDSASVILAGFIQRKQRREKRIWTIVVFPILDCYIS